MALRVAGPGVLDQPVPVAVTVTVSGDRIVVDLTGSSPATKGPINCGRAQTLSAVRMAFRLLKVYESDATGGSFRNLELACDPGGMFDAQEPAPCEWYYSSLGLLIDLIITALAEALPHRVAAAQFGDSAPCAAVLALRPARWGAR